MTSEEGRFLNELDLFRGECEAASQHLYAYLAIHATARRRKRVFRAISRYALFWNTVLGALQASSLITLGRVFDQDTPHNVDALLKLARANSAMFSKAALARRKLEQGVRPEVAEARAAEAHEVTAADFRNLRKHVDKQRRIYVTRYRDLRHMVFAHTVAHGSEVTPIAAKANINQLKRLISSLLSLEHALRLLFWDGRQPILQRFRYAAKRRKGEQPSNRPHEDITSQAERVLKDAASPKSYLLSKRVIYR
jgi:hypothetical protein